MSTTQEPAAKKGSGGKIAAIILAITTVLGLAWGGVMTSKYNNEVDANKAANSQIAGDSTDIANYQASLAKLREELGIDDKKIAQDAKNLEAEVAVAKQLRTKYNEAQKNDNSLQAQVMTANAKYDLASQCASILASGYEALYKDVASGVTYKEVADQLKAATEPCKGVIQFQPLTK